jgi:hypothetical protein
MRRPLTAALLVFATLSTFAQTEWITPFEERGYNYSPPYDETIDYFKRLAERSDYGEMIAFGETARGRTLYVFVASKDRAFTPEVARASENPVVLIINGIHSGEIMGKDASMILLRETLVEESASDLLDRLTLLVVPVYNADGHERSSPYNRINQNGPETTGWRTTAQNLNLNRDWLKADAPETRAILSLARAWDPDVVVDNHTDDGADFQYPLTYGVEDEANVERNLAAFTREEFVPHLEARLEEEGYPTAPYFWYRDGDPMNGLIEWVGTPRYSHSYFAARNRLALLIETHALKPYKTRVFADLAAMKATLEFVNENAEKIRRLVARADAETVQRLAIDRKPYPIRFRRTDEPDTVLYRGVRSVREPSDISGAERIIYTGEPLDVRLPNYRNFIVADSVTAPYAWIIPPEWRDIAERLELHGVEIGRLEEAKKLEATTYRLENAEFASAPYEGRHTVEYDVVSTTETTTAPAGSFVVRAEQPTLRLLLYALEPASEESFARWGFFNAIFEQKEWFSPYRMETIAAEMYESDPALRLEFENKLATDEAFRNDPRARLTFFYERSPYADEQKNRYPIIRVERPTEF